MKFARIALEICPPSSFRAQMLKKYKENMKEREENMKEIGGKYEICEAVPWNLPPSSFRAQKLNT